MQQFGCRLGKCYGNARRSELITTGPLRFFSRWTRLIGDKRSQVNALDCWEADDRPGALKDGPGKQRSVQLFEMDLGMSRMAQRRRIRRRAFQREWNRGENALEESFQSQQIVEFFIWIPEEELKV